MNFIPYRPRSFQSLGEWQPGDLRLKAYGISAGEAGISEELATVAARVAEAEAVPASRGEGQSHGLGFAILHLGTGGIWLLTHWWIQNDICCQRLSRAELGALDFESVDHRPLMACVWEIRIIEYESRAWVRTMLSGTPSPTAYLADRLPDGHY